MTPTVVLGEVQLPATSLARSSDTVNLDSTFFPKVVVGLTTIGLVGWLLYQLQK